MGQDPSLTSHDITISISELKFRLHLDFHVSEMINIIYNYYNIYCQWLCFTLLSFSYVFAEPLLYFWACISVSRLRPVCRSPLRNWIYCVCLWSSGLESFHTTIPNELLLKRSLQWGPRLSLGCREISCALLQHPLRSSNQPAWQVLTPLKVSRKVMVLRCHGVHFTPCHLS